MFLQILSKVGLLFIILSIGALARRKKLLNKESTSALARIVLVVTLPFLYFYSLSSNFTFGMLRDIWMLPVFAVLVVAGGYVIAMLLSRFAAMTENEKKTFIYAATFTNCGFLAIPIANSLYGLEGVVRVVFFNVGFNLLYWTLGIRTLQGPRGDASSVSGNPALLKNLLNSGTIGLLLGIAAGLALFKIPGFIMDSARILGSATIPLALLAVGSMMSEGRITRLRAYRRPLLLIILCRLIAVPALALFITGMFDSLPHLVRAIIVLQSAMPSASTSPIFTARFGGDPQLASSAVFATTACSIVTVPLFMFLL